MTAQSPLYVQRLTPTALMPMQGNLYDAGFDVHADIEKDVTIYSGHRALISTGLAVACPTDCYVRVAPRSGLAFKNGIDVFAGVVDSGYRGEVGVILYNTDAKPFVVTPHMRIAQLIVEVIRPSLIEEVESLPDTVRGTGGFGSTG